MMPDAGGEYRAEQMTLLAGLVHERRTDPRIGDWLSELHDSPLAADPHSVSGATIRELKRQYDKRVKLPQSLVEELTRTSVLGQQAWVPARANNDFKSFRPLLEKTFQLKREQAQALGYPDRPYDALLDDFEPGALDGRSGPACSRICASGSCRWSLRSRDSKRRPNIDLLTRHYPLDAQERFRSGGGRAGRLRVRARPARCDGPSVLHRTRPARLPHHDALRRAAFPRRVFRHVARSGARHLRPRACPRPVRPAAGRRHFVGHPRIAVADVGEPRRPQPAVLGLLLSAGARRRFPRRSATCRSTTFISRSTTCGRR